MIFIALMQKNVACSLTGSRDAWMVKLELQLQRADIWHSLNPLATSLATSLATFFTYRGNDGPINREAAIVLLRKAQFQKHQEPARIVVTIERKDNVSEKDWGGQEGWLIYCLKIECPLMVWLSAPAMEPVYPEYG